MTAAPSSASLLSLSSLLSRIGAVEGLLQRAVPGAVVGAIKLAPLPALHEAKEPHSASASSSAAASSASAALAPSPHTVHSKLSELTHAFHAILSQDASLQAYLASQASLQSTLSSHAQSAPRPAAGAAARLAREEEVVVSASHMFERTAHMLQQTQELQTVIDQKWPIEDFSSLNARASALEAAIPARAFLAAQQHVHFEHFLREYSELIDLCNRQFVLWSTQLDSMEAKLDAKIAQKARSK